MPKAHQRHLEWTPSRLIDWARTLGPQTAALVEAILADRPHPEQGYRSCLGVLRLVKRYGATRLEAACARAVAVGARSYRQPLGGPQFLRFVRGPLGQIPLLPTSGPTSENLADYFDAGAVAIGVAPEVFPPGFTLEGVEQAARRLRRAVDAWRAARGRGSRGSAGRLVVALVGLAAIGAPSPTRRASGCAISASSSARFRPDHSTRSPTSPASESARSRSRAGTGS